MWLAAAAIYITSFFIGRDYSLPFFYKGVIFMPIVTRCLKCKVKISHGESYCDKHKPTKTHFRNHQKKLNIKEDEKGKMSGRRWRELRERVISRDLGCCRFCLINGYGESKNLEVHHLLKRVDREDLIYDMDNLVTLCATHHRMLEDLPYEEQLRLLKLSKR